MAPVKPTAEYKAQIEAKVQEIMKLLQPWLDGDTLRKGMALTALQHAAGRLVGICSRNDDEVVTACCYIAGRLPEIAMEHRAKLSPEGGWKH